MLATAAGTFTHSHIALTAVITAVIAGTVGYILLSGHRRAVQAVIIGVVAGLAVYLWRASANMPPLNNDGIAGYSANDWLAPVIVFVALSVYADLWPPGDPTRFGRVRAAATIGALAVNVITI